MHAGTPRHVRLACTEHKKEMELREAFVEGENEPFREAEIYRGVELAGDGGFNPGTDAFEHAANIITLQVSSVYSYTDSLDRLIIANNLGWTHSIIMLLFSNVSGSLLLLF
jgi:FMN phosphatase YigB (HAD superfamily)